MNIIDAGQFKLYGPPAGQTPDDAWIARRRRANDAFLRTFADDGPVGRITGSFIYAHPPDYVGRPCLDYDVAHWRDLLTELRRAGVDTVIFQASAWRELGECYYPSDVLADYRIWNVLDPLIEAVAAESMTLFLGGMGFVGLLAGRTPDRSAIDRACDLQRSVFDELARYRGGFHGVYLSAETGYVDRADSARVDRVNQFLRITSRAIKQQFPDLPILASPSTRYLPRRETAIADYLQATFNDCAIDIIAPQDSVGTLANPLADLDPAFAIWRRVCDTLGVRLWANCELFERVRFGVANGLVAADPDRIRAQLIIADRFAEKIIAWEMPCFMPRNAPHNGAV